MLMYTSCGWFFDDISGIEAVQVLKYASRAMQLFTELTGRDLEPEFKERLQQAPCRAPGLATGKDVYEAHVEPARIDLNRVAAHFALSSLFDDYGDEVTDVYAYSATMEGFHRLEAGIQVLTTSRASIVSQVTLETQMVEIAALYLGETNIFASVRPRGPDDAFGEVRARLEEAFRRGETSEVMRHMGQAFSSQYSLPHLFRDQQRRILDRLLRTTWQEIESSFRHIYEHHYALMQMLRNMNMHLPKGLAAPAEFVIDQELIRHLQADRIDVGALRDLANEAARLSVSLDVERLRFEGAHRIAGLMHELNGNPQDLQLLEDIEKTLEVLKDLAPNLEVQDAQNVFFALAKQEYGRMKDRAESQDAEARQWVEHFENLAQRLELAIP